MALAQAEDVNACPRPKRVKGKGVLTAAAPTPAPKGKAASTVHAAAAPAPTKRATSTGARAVTGSELLKRPVRRAGAVLVAHCGGA